MNLFNKKALERHLGAAPLPADHLAALQRWSELIGSGRIHRLKETELHGQFTSGIVEGVLGYRGPAHGASYTVAAEQAILRGSVDLALGRFGGAVPEIVAPFELKGAGTRDLDAIMPGRNKSPVQQAWEYATGARGVKWVLVSNYIELRLYGFGEGTAAFESFRLDRLTDPREYARFMLLLSADNLLSGRTRELLEESRREDRDITDSVYRDYRGLRHTLIAAVRAADPGLDPLAGIATAQKVLDRVLFIAFAEDTVLLPRNTLGDAFKNRDPYNPRPVWDNFIGLFKAIDQGSDALRIPRYNGGLFEADAAIDALSLPDSVCEGLPHDRGLRLRLGGLRHHPRPHLRAVDRRRRTPAGGGAGRGAAAREALRHHRPAQAGRGGLHPRLHRPLHRGRDARRASGGGLRRHRARPRQGGRGPRRLRRDPVAPEVGRSGGLASLS